MVIFSAMDNSALTPSPSSKRKNLLLQHQQRSSMDTEALECEEQYYEKVNIRCFFKRLNAI